MTYKNLKEKIVGATGSLSGISSILGSWQICHSVCLGLIALLGLIGIGITGMPLEFLTGIKIPLWVFAAILFIVILVLFFRKHCISPILIFFNLSLLIAGFPFFPQYQVVYWSLGIVIVSITLVLFLIKKIKDIDKLMILFLGILVTVGILYSILGSTKILPFNTVNLVQSEKSQNINQQAQNTYNTIQTGSTSNGDVSIELTPHQIKNGKLNVDLAANTHSVTLNSYDLIKITRLESAGKVYYPISAPVMNGHHVTGTMIFDINSELEGFSIIIIGIPNVKERIFEW